MTRLAFLLAAVLGACLVLTGTAQAEPNVRIGPLVRIESLDCASNPERVVIRNFGDEAQPMAGWELWSPSVPLASPGSDSNPEIALIPSLVAETRFVARWESRSAREPHAFDLSSVGIPEADGKLDPGEAISVFSGSEAPPDDPSQGHYRWTTEFRFGDGEFDDVSLHNESGTPIQWVVCGDVPWPPTPTPTPSPLPSPTPTLSPTPPPLATPTPSPTATPPPAGTYAPRVDILLSDYGADANADITTRFSLDAPDYNFGAVVTLTPPQWFVASGADVPIGAVVGTLGAQATLGLLNKPCVSAVGPSFELLNASTDTSDTVSWSAGFLDVIPANGLPDAVDHYPDFLNLMFPGTIPWARLYGQASVAGTDIPLNFVLFEPGTFLPNLPVFESGWGYPSVTVLNPLAFETPPISDFCTPLEITKTVWGLSRDNPDTPVDESGYEVRRNPPFGGSYDFWTYTSSLLDADADGYENQLDTCPLDVNMDESPREGNGPDGDGIDSVCDPDPGEGCWLDPPGSGEDCDGDGYMNRGDNCPLVFNPGNADDDSDGIGDACDPDPFDWNGTWIDLYPRVGIDISGPLGTPVATPTPPVTPAGGGPGVITPPVTGAGSAPGSSWPWWPFVVAGAVTGAGGMLLAYQSRRAKP